jgi:hypothetical protein
MPSQTRAQQRQAFNHVLDNVLERGDGSTLKTALVTSGFETMRDLMSITTDQIVNLGYTYTPEATAPSGETEESVQEEEPSSPVEVHTLPSDQNLIRLLRAFWRYRHAAGSPIEDWNMVTQEEFDEFRTDPDNDIETLEAARVAGTTSLRVTDPPRRAPSPRQPTPAEMFRRGIKRDQSLFPTLKDERFNDSWHRSFVNQSRAQGLTDVLSATYMPTGVEQIELFREQQLYMYAILEAKVLTDAGKAIIRRHKSTSDAQKAYVELTEHHLRSTKAMIDSSMILSYITSVRIGNGEFHGTAENFVLHWQQQVRLYQRQVPTTDHFSDGQLRTMLENAVAPIEELRQVKVHGDLHKTKTGKALTYDEYSALLLSAATQYDSQNAKPRRGTTKSRTVYNHDITHDDNDVSVESDEEDSYGIDHPVQSLNVHAHDRKFKTKWTQRVSMPRDRWYALSKDAQSIWDKLSDADKAIILGKDTGSGDKKLPPTRKINLHETSVYDFVCANMHEVDVNDSTTDAKATELDDTADVKDEPHSETLLIHAAKSGNITEKKLHPGDIRRVMSKTSTRTVKMADVSYTVSLNQQKATTYSLVDRGANGGVAGNDVRIIFKTNRTVDIRGIDNHQVTDIDIGTVGGVVQSQKGPIIAIMHQYALLNKGHSIHSPCQFESHKVTVDDKSVRAGGTQRIQTPDGYTIPLSIKDGLVRLAIRPYTDQEYDTLPHVFLTAEDTWDASKLDHELDPGEQYCAQDVCFDERNGTQVWQDAIALELKNLELKK